MAVLSAALAERDWSQVITLPTEEQLSQPGDYRSPYITFMPETAPEGFTAFAMDLRIDHDPVGTYICPACWNLGYQPDGGALRPGMVGLRRRHQRVLWLPRAVPGPRGADGIRDPRHRERRAQLTIPERISGSMDEKADL